jgi:hypothetical protein
MKGIFAFLVDIILPYESLTFGNGGSRIGSSPNLDVGAGFEPRVGGNGSFLAGGGLNFSAISNLGRKYGALVECVDVAGSKEGETSPRAIVRPLVYWTMNC